MFNKYDVCGYSDLIKLRKHIAPVLIAISVFGLFLSMAHYHDTSLDCLHHSDEQHFTQNTVVCPVCTVIVHHDSEANQPFNAFISFESYIESFDELILFQEHYNTPLGRAPPFMG